jgi:hypothetical protein
LKARRAKPGTTRAVKPYLQRISLRDDLELDRSRYPLSIAALKDFETLEFHPDVTFLSVRLGCTFLTSLKLPYHLNANLRRFYPRRIEQLFETDNDQIDENT